MGINMNCKLFLAFFVFFAAAALFSQQKVDPLTVNVSAAPLWEIAVNDTIKGKPHTQAGSVVLVGDNGSVRSFFMSGTPLWNFDARGKAVPYIARSYEAATYVCGTDGVFRTINRVGRELWNLNLSKPISHLPVVGWDGRVYIPVDSVVTCRTSSGHSLWTLDIGSPIAFEPILDSTGSFATVLQNMDFVKLDQFSNLERIRLNRLPVMIVSVIENARQSYVLMYQSGEMEKILFDEKAVEGKKLSRTNFRSLPAQPAASASCKNMFAVTLKDGKILCMDAQGNTIWTKNTHEASEERGSGNIAQEQAVMIFDDRGVYSITTRGVSAFSAEGRRRFVFRLSFECSGVPAFSDEGILYACGKDNILRVYRIDSKPRTVSVTRFYGPEPEGTYGMSNPPPSPWTGDRTRYVEENQLRVYAEMESVIRSGQLGKNEPVYTAYMMEMIGFFLGAPQSSQVRPLVRPEQRIRLIELLAHIGSRETIPFLWNIFDKDPEPAVRRACADAIGIIGVDPTGRSFYSYNFLLSPNNPNIDPQLVLAATSSIAKLCRFSGPPLAPEGIRILRYFSNLPSLPNPIKAQINNEIDGLFREGLDQMIQ
jgi:outer membrane protein assembly factor BamB